MKHCGSVMNLATRDDPGVVTICDNKEYRNINVVKLVTREDPVMVIMCDNKEQCNTTLRSNWLLGSCSVLSQVVPHCRSGGEEG